MELSSTELALIAIIAAVGLVGVIAIDMVTFAQEAEAKGCISTPGANASKTRCVHL